MFRCHESDRPLAQRQRHLTRSSVGNVTRAVRGGERDCCGTSTALTRCEDGEASCANTWYHHEDDFLHALAERCARDQGVVAVDAKLVAHAYVDLSDHLQHTHNIRIATRPSRAYYRLCVNQARDKNVVIVGKATGLALRRLARTVFSTSASAS